MLVREVGQALNINDIAGGIAYGLTKYRFGVGVEMAGQGVKVVVACHAHLYSLIGEGVGE